MTLIVGILNITPDSFSDGGEFVDDDENVDVEGALTKARVLAAEGADVIDVGGESTRPGSPRVSEKVEAARIFPVVERLVAEGFTVSVDTTRPRIADTVCRLGADIINDVSGGLAESQGGRPEMADVVSEHGVRWVIMHWREHSIAMYDAAEYEDSVVDVRTELEQRVEVALAAGVSPEQIIVDPGIGFSKRPKDDWALLRALDSFNEMGFPLLIGASRKSFLGAALPPYFTKNPPDGTRRSRLLEERDVATAVISLHAASIGAWGVRVHNVRATADAFAIQRALEGKNVEL